MYCKVIIIFMTLQFIYFVKINKIKMSKPWPFKYPCIDKYPEGQHFLTNQQLFNMASKELSSRGLKGKLSTKLQFKKLKAAFKISSLWDTTTHPDLKITFLDGTEKQINWVKKVISENLEPLMTKMNFVWGAPIIESDIRITFSIPNQAWSMLGSESLQVPKNQPTMNLGWLDNDTQFGSEQFKNTGQVVLHEFGHAVGMIHEHQSPLGDPLKWNKDVVYEELLRTNGWDRQMVDQNMFKKYGDYQLCEDAKAIENVEERNIQIENFCQGELVNGSKYDPTSIMHYFFPQSWILEGQPIPVNTTYSENDKKWIRQYYGEPVPDTPTEVILKNVTEAVEETKDSVDKKIIETPIMTSVFIFTSSLVIMVLFIVLLWVYAGRNEGSSQIPVSPYMRQRRK